MLTVKTYIDKSPIHGIGLFAGEFIKAGALVWEYHPWFNSRFMPSEIDGLPAVQMDFIRHYAYKDICQPDGYIVLDVDDARFLNHSDKPNLVHSSDEQTLVAACDIAEGTELTGDYRTFDGWAESKLGGE